MKIEKLELKHLCGYLPYGLKVSQSRKHWATPQRDRIVTLTGVADIDGKLPENYNNSIIDYFTVFYRVDKFSTGSDISDQFKPLLLPLSALTEPLEDGTVPIVELAEKYVSIYGTPPNRIEEEKRNFIKAKMMLVHMKQQYKFSQWITEYLYSKHFDIYGLIDAGLAIDKRTIKI